MLIPHSVAKWRLKEVYELAGGNSQISEQISHNFANLLMVMRKAMTHQYYHWYSINYISHIQGQNKFDQLQSKDVS